MNLPRTLRTLRHLKAEQLRAQLRHAFGGRLRPPAVDPARVGWAIDSLTVPPLPPPAHTGWDGAGRVELVGRAVAFDSIDAIDFGHSQAGPFWAYQLHFFEWARSRQASAGARADVLVNWLRQPASSPAWDPHPISVRTLSWLKLRLGGELPEDFAGSPVDATLCASLASQVEWLSRNAETRLQANHLLENWVAVVAGGLALDAPGSEAWRAAWHALRAELDEQIGADGAHCERSPMYHALLLEHLLDLLSVARAAAHRAPAELTGQLEDVCGRMLTALELWTHPDGDIALFGDAAFGIAQLPEVLTRYAQALGVVPAAAPEPGLLRSTGHARLETSTLCCVASLGGPAPACQPGHAHCDALAFELSVAGQRVVTDTGVFEYTEGDRRQQSRATAAHATLEVGGREQAEIWAAHRVGGRPRVRLERWEPGACVEGSCAGWSTPATRHWRRFEIDGDDLVVLDRLEGRPQPVRAVLPLAPGCEPSLHGSSARVELPGGGALRISLPEGLDWRVEDAPYYPTFSEEHPRRTLVGSADRFESGTWRFQLER